MSFRRLRRFSFGRPDLNQDIREELEHHLDLLTEELVEKGLSPPAAREEAESRFGKAEIYEQTCREMGEKRHRVRRRREWGLGLWSDLRLAGRTLAKSPGFAAVAILTLALGIGATTALTSIVDAVILRPLAYPDPDQLMVIHETSGRYRHVPASPANFLDWREQSQSFESMAALGHNDFTLTGNDDPRKLRGFHVTEDFFDVLGLAPTLGRVLTPSEITGKKRVVVLSHATWQGILGGSEDVLGRVLQLDGLAHTVVGVMPPEMDYPRMAQFWLPMGELSDARGAHYLEVIGRLKTGVPRSAAVAELTTLAGTLASDYPETNKGYGINPQGLDFDLVESVRPTFWMLLAAVAAVLVIGCVNVANLTLARATRRRRELAMRAALGCGASRLVRLLVVESLLVAVVGGVLGLALAWVLLKVGLGAIPNEIPRLEQVTLDVRLLVFGLGLSLFSAWLFGFLPAWWVARGNFSDELSSGRSSALSASPAARFLVTAEVAVALIMVMTAGLLLRSFEQVLRVDGGFDASNVLTMKVQLPDSRYSEGQQRSAFFEQLIEKVGVLPGVQSAAVIPWLPLESGWNLGFRIDGRPEPEIGEEPWAEFRWISSDYFETLGIPLLRGRSLDQRDRAGSEGVVVISEELARLHFPDQDPLGHTLNVESPGGDERVPRRVVGIARDVKHWRLTRGAAPMLYVPQAQEAFSAMRLAVRTAAEPLALADGVRREIWAMDPLLAIDDVRTMEQRYQDQLGGRRFTLQLVLIFAVVALGLSALGIYGVLAQVVAGRSAEIGVRVALGATARDVVRWTLHHGVKMVATGVVVGILGALATTRLLSSLLFETSTTDPLTYAAVVAVLSGVAMLACWIPARRALRVDPVVALRDE